VVQLVVPLAKRARKEFYHPGMGKKSQRLELRVYHGGCPSWEYQGSHLSYTRYSRRSAFVFHQGTPSSLPEHTSTMSQASSTATSSTNFETIFRTALTAYKKQTKQDITSHPLLAQLQSCDSPSAILVVLRAQIQLIDSQNADDKLTKWLDPTVNVLYAFSATLGNGIGLVRCDTSNCSKPAF